MKMQKLRANESDSGIVDCGKCGKPVRVTNLSQLADTDNLVRVTCACGATTEAQYERRAFLRLLSSRSGVYRKTAPQEESGAITVVDTSINGVRFRTSGPHTLRVQDLITIEYESGLKGAGRIRHEVVVQRIEDRLVGARLADKPEP